MSFTSEPEGYREVVSQGIIAKSNFMENEPQCASPLKQENIEESLIINEEIVVSTNGYSPGKVDCQTESMYFEDDLETCNDIPARLEESIDSVPLSEVSSITEKWDCEDVEAPALKENKFEEQEDDEETIATFVTAAGQQLALYAVEDSDEIFAVTVYDESDNEPPNNFQFLMKADVERLIGEGAVRTVKKPSQMKKRVFTAQPPTFYHREVNDKISSCDILVNSEKDVAQEDSSRIEHNYETYQNYSDFTKINSESSDSVHATVDEQSNITYLMMNDSFVDIAEQPDGCQENVEFEDKLIEHSTVQYILLEADHQSESELTFDEIQATLQNMKISRKKLLETNDKKSDKLEDNHSTSQQDLYKSKEESLSEDANVFELYMSPQSTIDRTCASVSEDDRQRLIDTLTDSPPSTKIISQTPLKVKRSRKQQLISVDRDDGEIVIQLASMMNDELTGIKHATRVRRRRLSSKMRAAMAAKGIKRTRRIKRPKRRKIVEVIDLDVDEEEQQTTRNVVEITLDDNKDKCSSDKENEIIMVRDSSDSDHEEEDEKTEWESGGGHLTKLNGVIRCEYCSRNFRYRRTLDMHLLVCEKSPTKTLNLGKRKPKDKANKKIKKQFICKICQEKFDAVVVLARHVRLVHLQRKKNKLSLSSKKSPSKSLRSIREKETNSTEEEESDDEDDTEKELSMLTRVKRKRKQRNNYSDTKKLDCADCGRWFPSITLLNAHSLQHGTKKSEQLHKCHICKKLIKSRLLFLRHLRMHNNTRNSDSSSRMMRRKLRARPSTLKIAPPRKRGRPRKF